MVYNCSFFVPSRVSIKENKVGVDFDVPHNDPQRITRWGTSKTTPTLLFMIMWTCEISIISLKLHVNSIVGINFGEDKDMSSNPAATFTYISITIKHHFHKYDPNWKIPYLKATKSLEFLLNSKLLNHWNIGTLNVRNNRQNVNNYLYVVHEVICFVSFNMAMNSSYIQD